MTKKELIEDAAKLRQPSTNALDEYVEKKSGMADQLYLNLINTNGFEDAVPVENFEMLKDNLGNQFRFMESVFGNFVPEVFVNTVLWAVGTYRNHGFEAQFWDYLYPAALMVYKDNLSPATYNELAPFYKWMQHNHPVVLMMQSTN